jgi:CheY-like chemotaxis protein
LYRHGYFGMGRAKDQVLTVLLVEDEGIIRMALAAILEDAGYEVLDAVDAEEALITLSGHPEVDVVVTDVQMPGKFDGLKLVELISQDYPLIRTYYIRPDQLEGSQRIRSSQVSGETLYSDRNPIRGQSGRDTGFRGWSITASRVVRSVPSWLWRGSLE